jgi:hypothetical protein
LYIFGFCPKYIKYFVPATGVCVEGQVYTLEDFANPGMMSPEPVGLEYTAKNGRLVVESKLTTANAEKSDTVIANGLIKSLSKKYQFIFLPTVSFLKYQPLLLLIGSAMPGAPSAYTAAFVLYRIFSVKGTGVSVGVAVRISVAVAVGVLLGVGVVVT